MFEKIEKFFEEVLAEIRRIRTAVEAGVVSPSGHGEGTKRNAAGKKGTEAAPAAPAAEPAPAVDFTSAAAAAPAAPAPAPEVKKLTLKEVGDAIVGLAQKQKSRDGALAILAKYGAKTGKDLKEEDFPKVIADVNAELAKIKE